MNLSSRLLLAATILGSASFAHATDKYMNSGAGGAVWDTTTLDWGTSAAGPYNTVAWVAYDDAHFVGTGGTATLSSNQSVNHLYFESNGYTISGATLVFGNPGTTRGINVSGSFTATINSNITTLSAGNQIALNASGYTGLLIINGQLTNVNGGVTIGGGSVTLTSANTYTGTTAVNGGTLNLTGSLTSAITVASGATLTGTGSTTGNISFSAGSSLVLNAGGAVQGATVTVAGTTNLYVTDAPTGSLVTRDVIRYTGTTPGTANFSAATNYRSGVLTDDTTNKKITLAYQAEAKTWAATTGGTWDIGTNTPWTGGSDTKFYWGDSVSFGDTAANQTVTLTGNLAASSVSVSNAANTYTFSGTGAISGAGSLIKSGAGTLIVTTTNTYTGTTTVNDGVLQVGDNTATGQIGNNSAGSSVVINSPGKLSVYRSGSSTFNNSVRGAGTLEFKGSGVSLNGDYDIGGNNTAFTGDIQVTNARIRLDNTNDLGAATVTVNAGGQLYLTNATTYANAITLNGIGWTESAGNLGAVRFSSGATLAGAITLASDSRLHTHSSGDTGSVNGIISGGFRIEKSGAGTLTLNNNANSYSGGTLVSAGTLVAGNAGAFGSGLVTVNTGGTLNINAKSIANAMSVNGGTLSGAAGSAVAGTVTVGASGVVVASGASITLKGVTLATGAITVNGTGLFTKTGTLAFAGTGVLDLGNNFDGYAGGTTYKLISGSVTGGFSNITGFSNSVWSQVTFDNTTGNLVFTAVPEPSTYGLIGAGALALAAGVRRRRKFAGSGA